MSRTNAEEGEKKETNLRNWREDEKDPPRILNLLSEVEVGEPGEDSILKTKICRRNGGQVMHGDNRDFARFRYLARRGHYGL